MRPLMRSLFLLAVLGAAWLLPSSAPARPGRARGVPLLTSEGKPNIQAQAAIIIDLAGGDEIFAKNPDAVRPIASISKLMAAIVVMDTGLKLDETQTITVEDTKIASRGSRSRLVAGMKLTNRDLLHAALIASDNRAVPALGRSVGWNPQQMAAAMTAKAHALGLRHTEFKDPTGLDDGNVSTPRETIRMLQTALANPTLSDILRKSNYVVHPAGRGAITYQNTDRLVKNARWSVMGGKTGYTDIARYCLVVAAKVGERPVAMAFLGAEGKLTRFGDFTRSAEWLLKKKDKDTAVAGTTSTPSPAAAAPAAAPVGPTAPTPASTPAAVVPAAAPSLR